MSAASSKLKPTTSSAIPKSTSLPGSLDGQRPSGSPIGPTLDLFSQPHAPVRLSVAPVKRRRALNALADCLSGALGELASQYAQSASTLGLPMPATYGRKPGGSSPSDGLSASLANRLQANPAFVGSPEFEVAWKSSAMVLGAPIFQLVASARLIFDRESSGWPTPGAVDATSNADSPEAKKARGSGGINLTTAALSAWATPAARDYRHPNATPFSERGGGKKGEQLPNQAQFAMAGWQTPTEMDAHRGDYSYDRGDHENPRMSNKGLVSGWTTPQAHDERGGTPKRLENTRRRNLMDEVYLTGWPTPQTDTFRSRSGGRKDEMGLDQIARGFGTTPSSSSAQTEKRAVLSPKFSLWLMGFPDEWGSYAQPVTRSPRRSPPNS